MSDLPNANLEPSQEGKRGKKPLHITPEHAASLEQSYRWGRITTLTCYGLLLVLFTYINLMRPETDFRNWCVAIFPLLIFIPGLVKNTHRTYSWLCFIILMYFLIYIPLAMTRGDWTDWVIVAIVSVFFIAAMMTSRWLQYWNYYRFVQNKKA
jgi:uncharacterized membrane protein